LRLVVGSVASNWSTGTISQRDEILRRELAGSFLSASPSALKDAGVKPGWPVRLRVPHGDATVAARADPRLPADVLVLVAVAGSTAAALRGCLVDSTGRGIGLQPVPARIERA
jgi:predicted molibdopterin-dependent oxidoreductase YjgC